MKRFDNLQLIKVGESRTGRQRYYRIFSIVEGLLLEVTGIVCRAAGLKWDNVRGSYVASEPYEFQDAEPLTDKVKAGTIVNTFR